jgi:hypothetical protein
MKIYWFGMIALLAFNGCSNNLEKNLLSAQRVEVYNITSQQSVQNDESSKQLLSSFPFVSNQQSVGYDGKFSDEFYYKTNSNYHAASIKDVNYWKLQANPSAENVIYALPSWVKQFKRVSNNLLENVGYSNNLSADEQKILLSWISQGGVLWIEGGLYSTRYDTFNKDGAINSKAIKSNVENKSAGLELFGKKVNTYLYQSEIMDIVNFEPIKLVFKTKSNISELQDIKNLEIRSDNYYNADFIPQQGDVLLSSNDGKPLVTFIPVAKGGIMFLRPFEYQDKMYDGELLRWKLMNYILTRSSKSSISKKSNN